MTGALGSRENAPLDLAQIDEAAFERLYRERIEPCFVEHEPLRRAAVASFNRRLAIALPLAVAAAVAAGYFAEHIAFAAVAALIGGGMAWAFAYMKLAQVGAAVKLASLTAIAQATGVRYAPAPPGPPALMRFRALKLVPRWDRSTFEDWFSGSYKDADFDLYEARLETETRDSKGRRSYSTVFRGQLLRLAFPRKFLGVTIVRRDAGIFNALGALDGGAGRKLARIGLEDPKFEKVFEVYGSDQVEARYLVHPVLMERLMALEAMLKGQKLRCAFEEGELLIAVEGGDRFEPGDLFKPLTDRARARRIVDEFALIMRVMDATLTAQARRPNAR